MKNSLIGVAVAGVLAAGFMPTSAHAQSVVRVAQSTAVFAGPGYDYPQLDRVGWNQPIRVYGCLRQVAWCDVGYGYGYGRGWVDADDLMLDRGGQLYSFQSATTLYPIVNFVLSVYWDQHYRHANWYGHRSRYSQWDWQRQSHGWNQHRDRDYNRYERHDAQWPRVEVRTQERTTVNMPGRDWRRTDDNRRLEQPIAGSRLPAPSVAGGMGPRPTVPTVSTTPVAPRYQRMRDADGTPNEVVRKRPLNDPGVEQMEQVR